MKRIHVALAVRDFEQSLREYSERLGAGPCCTVDGTYALWRTDQVNLSISVKPESAGTLRHLGFEDPEAPAMSVATDPNGFDWEHFTAEQQRKEILSLWPNARFH